MNTLVLFEIKRQQKQKIRRYEQQIEQLNRRKEIAKTQLTNNPNNAQIQRNIDSIDKQIEYTTIQLKKVKRNPFT